MNNSDYLIKLIDGKIKHIYADVDYISGDCPTCDFGSKYINQFKIVLSNREIEIEITDECGYYLSNDYFIKLFANNIEDIKLLTEKKFIEWLKEKIREEIKDNVEEISFKLIEKIEI